MGHASEAVTGTHVSMREHYGVSARLSMPFLLVAVTAFLAVSRAASVVKVDTSFATMLLHSDAVALTITPPGQESTPDEWISLSLLSVAEVEADGSTALHVYNFENQTGFGWTVGAFPRPAPHF